MTELLAEVRAAYAEALHVAGRFEVPALEFERLAAEGHQPGESTLKAAIAHFAAGETGHAVQLLDRAVSLGAPRAEVTYVRAQVLWAAGFRERARQLLTLAAAEDQDGPARNTLAVYLSRDGRRDEAAAVLEPLVSGGRSDPQAIANFVNLQGDRLDLTTAAELTARAVAAAPHRHEALVAWGRLLRRRGHDEDARLALTQAKLRHGPPALAAHVEDRPVRHIAASGRVTGRIGPDDVDLGVTIVVDPRTWEDEPFAPVVNPGCQLIVEDDWHLGDDGWQFGGRIVGTPRGPATRRSDGDLEYGDASAWLPILPGLPIAWEVDVEAVGEPGDVDIVLHGGRRGGLGWCRLRDPAAVRLPDGTTAMGHAAPAALRELAAVAATVSDLLAREVGGSPPPSRTVLVVRQPGSAYCYARDGVLRVPSGAVERGMGPGLTAHEVGHWWWGIGTRFSPGEEWFAEALAEYTLHLASRSGLLPGYPSQAWAGLAGLPEGPPSTALSALARRTDRLSAHVLRVKGAYVVAMLGLVVGQDTLAQTLRRFRTLGETHELNVFTFFAIASMLHGASLDWFVRQWVETDAVLDVRLGPAWATMAEDHWAMEVTGRCLSVAVPGVPATVEIRMASGATKRVSLDVDAVEATARCTLDERPVEVRLDPDHRLYRTPSPAVPVAVRLDRDRRLYRTLSPAAAPEVLDGLA